MTGAALDVLAVLAATALVMVAPGAALLGAIRAWGAIPALLRPAGAVAGSVLVVAPALVLALAIGWSIVGLVVLVAAATTALAAVSIVRGGGRAGAGPGWRARLRSATPFALPGSIVFVLALVDAPQVRSDTYWHVALARKLAEVDALSSAAIAFEAGASGNANYPLPAWHALLAIAEQAPRVDAWFAAWFVTPWLGVVAMLAFGAMAGLLVGDRRASLAGCWTFLAVVVLGYGPWFFATRYLGYAGQVAIFVVLPVVVAAIVLAIGARGRARGAQLAIAAAGTVAIGVLHANYVLYPALFAGGAAVLLLVGARDRARAAFATTGVVVAAGALTLGAQLPWITSDDNFLRGDRAPAGEPTAFTRHRDVFVGSEQSFHVELGSLATQPLLVLGALALPVLLLLARRRPGPWVVTGGAVAIVVFARSPQLLELLDRLGSVTPATRFDRVWPAAIGVTAIALGIGWLLERSFGRGRAFGSVATAATLAVVVAGSWWADSIRDTRRIVVTPFVEARWVGGLDPSGVPRVAVLVATGAIVAVAVWVRVRGTDRSLRAPGVAPRELRHTFAAACLGAVAIGLAPATAERVDAAFERQAYARSARDDATFVRVEVYPARARRVVSSLDPGAVVLASFAETRKVASLAPVQSVEESLLRQLEADPPDPAEARALLASNAPVRVDAVVASRADREFDEIVAAAIACGWTDRSAGDLRVHVRRGDRC